MAKRFTDTNKYKKPFMRSLPGPYKLLWDFLYHDCDHAGIWIVDFETAQIYIGKDMPIERQEAIRLFNSQDDGQRIIEIDNGKKWFVPSFIEFQYGQLSEKNRAHISAITALQKYGLLNPDNSILKENKPLTSPLQGAKDMDKDKDKDMDMVKGVVGGVASADFDENTLNTIFDEITLDSYRLHFRNIDVDEELKQFKLKVKNAWADYRGRDTPGMRNAFQFQLKSARPVKQSQPRKVAFKL